MLEQEAALFPVRKAWWYIERPTLGFGKKASQGADFFTADNPPFGAVFTYYLKDSLQTKKQVRHEQEKEVKEEGGDNPYPGWDALREEEVEEDPTLLMTVRDADGNVVRRLEAPGKAGIHRVAWDLTYPNLGPYDPDRGGGFMGPNTGPLVAPGTYSVSMAKRVDGVVTDLGQSQTFEVVQLEERGLKGAEPAVVAAFWKRLAEMNRVTEATHDLFHETEEKLETIRGALMSSTVNDNALDDQVRDIERRMMALHETLAGNDRRENFGDPGPRSVLARLGSVGIGTGLSTYGPTAMHKRQFEIAEQEFEEIHSAFEAILNNEIPALEAALDAAGVPWSSGRALPAGR
jgi:hypothetical protein